MELFQTTDGDGDRRLPDREFRRGEDLRRRDVEGLITRIDFVIASLFMTRFCTLPCSPDYIIPFGSGARGSIILSSGPSRYTFCAPGA